MYEINYLLKTYYSQCSTVTTYFYTFSPNINSDFEIREDILYIRGTETFIPGILDKTIKALQYFSSIFDMVEIS